MQKYFWETIQHWQYKVMAGIFAAVFTQEFWTLLFVFAMLELMDIFSRLLSQSFKCWRALYPQTPCSILRAIGFMWQARKWRFINSFGMRGGVDKLLMYVLLLLTGAMADVAFSIAKTPLQKPLTSVICVVLASTEALSILENFAECGQNNVVGKIRDMFKKKTPLQ